MKWYNCPCFAWLFRYSRKLDGGLEKEMSNATAAGVFVGVSLVVIVAVVLIARAYLNRRPPG
ncbi:MAG: hypothetical protein ACXU85_06435 [Xanthobacteraceae bacterium]